MLAAHVAGKATRDALFLTTFPVTRLPNAMVAAAAISLGSAALMARLLTRLGPGRVVPGVFGASALLFVAEWALVRVRPEVAAVLVYLHYTAFGAVLISSFWSMVNERFDPHSARPTIVRIGGFAALGGVVGGLGARLVSEVWTLPSLLLGLSILHGACALCAFGIAADGRARHPSLQHEDAYGASGLRVLRRTPFLLQMAALVGVVAVLDALVDYAFKVEATGRLADGEALIEFFAIFYTVAGLLAFVLQAGLGSRVLRGLGLGGAMALMPSAVMLAGSAAAVFPRLWSAVLVRGAALALSNSFFRSGFEVLYTPLDLAEKRPTKAYVDVGSQRLGDMAGGGVILLLLFLVPGLPSSVVLALAAALAGVALLLIVRLNRGYVRQLATKLRTGSLHLDTGDALDLTTHRALEKSRITIDREELLAHIQELERSEAGQQRSADRPQEDHGDTSPARTLDVFFERVRSFASDDPDQVRAALRASEGDLRLVPHAIGLLVRFDVIDDVLRHLREMAPRCLGQLTDALVGRDQRLLVRRRIPRVLESCEHPRAVDGLVLGLGDPDFEVRLQCARALARLATRDPGLRPSTQAIHAAVERELALDPRSWEQQGRLREETSGEPVLLAGITGTRSINRCLELVFTLLALELGLDMMRSALVGLHGSDAGLRGTALEYLDATLPEAIREALFPRLPGSPAHPAPRREGRQLAEELLRSSSRLRRADG
jgi:AAA family ATP:ADP antiporter